MQDLNRRSLLGQQPSPTVTARPASKRDGWRWLASLFLLPFLAACAGLDAPSPESSFPPVREWAPGQHGAWQEPSPQSPRLNLLLISLDTTRQDFLSCYGFEQPLTPNLDRIAAEGVLFERGTAPVPITLPSHTTMMTGLYPFHHGVRNNGTYVVHDSLTTLAEVLKPHGYRTGAVTAAFPVASQFQLNQGFDLYDDEFPTSSVRRESDTAQRTAGEVTTRSLEWLDEPIDESAPFFLWAHYFDPHYPYTPPEPFSRQYESNLYAGEIAYMDQEIGRLLDGLNERGLLETTVILVAGDHGESLGEHKEATHSFFVYNATQYVPYLIRFPETAPFEKSSWRGQTISSLVSLVDLMPTALDALGIPRTDAPASDGMSLLPLIADKQASRDWVYYESFVPSLEYGAAELRALERPQHKYIRAPRPELYDLDLDPKETQNIAQRDHWIADEMETDLAGLLRNESEAPTQVVMDAETIEKLRSLGYMAGANAPSTGGDGPAPDPKDVIGLYNQINDARTALAEHRPDDALSICERVLEANPNDGTAQRLRASALLRVNRADEAVQAYDDLLAACEGCPDQLDLLLYRALASHAAGNSQDALQRIDDLAQANPERPGLLLHRGLILRDLGRLDAARSAFAAEASRDPGANDAWVALGEMELQVGGAEAAESAFRQALAINAYTPAALAGLAEILIQTGRIDAARGLVEQAYAADPNLPVILFRKAWFARADGRNDEAMDLYERGLAREPENAPALYNLGNLAMQQGQFAKAHDLFQRAIRTGEAPQEAWVNLGALYAQRGQLTEAIRYWEQAIEVDPGSAIAAQVQANIDRAREEIKKNAFRPK